MKNTASIIAIFTMLIIPFIFQQCKLLNPLAQAEKVGIKLSYSFSGVGSINYVQDQKTDQELKAGSQSVRVTTRQKTDFNVFELSEQGNSIDLAVKLNSLHFDIQAGDQPVRSDLKDLEGREFQFLLTSSGREHSMDETDKITFEIIPGEKTSLTSIFKGFFPDLGTGILKKGDSWNSADTIVFKTENKSSELIIYHTHTLKGFEETGGYNCAVISDQFHGTLHAVALNQDSEIITRANVEGTSDWYFAFDKGIFIKETSSGSADGILKTKGEEMKLNRKFTIETKLVQ